MWVPNNDTSLTIPMQNKVNNQENKNKAKIKLSLPFCTTGNAATQRQRLLKLNTPTNAYPHPKSLRHCFSKLSMYINHVDTLSKYNF